LHFNILFFFYLSCDLELRPSDLIRTSGVSSLALPAGLDVKALLIVFVISVLLVDKILTLPRSLTSTTATLMSSSFDA